ncbi:MAG: tRNA (adenosine(37)-N6)-threonylcarbamoyltransferase complex dimerization subunit type 1 TsaB, partial [Flavitalea sp.]
MALIIAIDTAVDTAGVCLSADSQALGFLENERQKDHASWIHTAIRTLMNEAGFSMSKLNAVAVTAGPGSYTGLRVGMATAKGLCYALNIPLITENTLKVMAYAVKQEYQQTLTENEVPVLFCPMIDARRIEVFTALFNDKL